MTSMSEGSKLPPINGNSLYTRPASKPATKAPDIAVRKVSPAAPAANGRRRESFATGSVQLGADKYLRPVQRQPRYNANAVLRCAQRRYWLTRGTWAPCG